MIDGIFLLDNKGNVLIERKQIGQIPREIVEEYFQKQKNLAESAPISTYFKYCFAHVARDEIYLVATMAKESAVLMTMEYLGQLGDVLAFVLEKDTLRADDIRKGLVIVMQTIDETIDGGIPNTTDCQTLVARFVEQYK